MYVTREQIRQARRASLAEYLLRENPDAVRSAGNSLYLRDNRSLSIRRDVPGYLDFATGEHGNSIDFLVRHLGFSFTQAVAELSSAPALQGAGAQGGVSPARTLALPPKAAPPFGRVSAYLSGRGIPDETVMYLIGKGLLYQDRPYGNAVFINPEGDYCEIRGTGEKAFHGCRKSGPDRFWYLQEKPNPETAFVCEAAIDAISLMLLRKAGGANESAVYVSIGGVANQKAIDRLKKGIYVVLAVDNDAAGEACRKRNPDLSSIIPEWKDWNETLQKAGGRSAIPSVSPH